MTDSRDPDAVYLLADFAEKLDAQVELADNLRRLEMADVLRVFSAAGHELLHRNPDLDARELAGAMLDSVDWAHRRGLE